MSKVDFLIELCNLFKKTRINIKLMWNIDIQFIA